MSTEDSVAALRGLLEDRTDVRLAYLFGSAARGEARPASDLDIGIVFSPVPAPVRPDVARGF